VVIAERETRFAGLVVVLSVNLFGGGYGRRKPFVGLLVGVEAGRSTVDGEGDKLVGGLV
jgi:hypothetical protein